MLASVGVCNEDTYLPHVLSLQIGFFN